MAKAAKETWTTAEAVAKALKIARSTVFYYVRTGRLKHRHTFTRQGRRTEILLPSGDLAKLHWGALTHGEVASAKCPECR